MSSRICPQCGNCFSRSKKVLGIRHCPACSIALYYPSGKRAGQTILWSDKECADKLVKALEEHISRRNSLVFKFEMSEKSAELVHAYKLVERSRKFLLLQPDNLDLTPDCFIAEVLEVMLHDKFWSSITSLVMIRNKVGTFAQELFREKKENRHRQAIQLSNYVDYEVYYGLARV